MKGDWVMSANLNIRIPEWLDKICVCPLMAYRRLKYGYTFRKIYLGEGEFTIVEPADYYALGKFKWILLGTGYNLYAVHEVNILDELIIEPGAFYVMDRGFTDFARLLTFTESMAWFVIRAKSNLDYTRTCYRPVDKTTGLRSDQTISLKGPLTSHCYPAPLRRIGYYDVDNQRKLIFLTNNFTLDALTITKLYKCRWQIELFFKWLKQHLHIKAFFGTSDNAVKTQIWIAVSIYVLIAIIKKELLLRQSLAEILQILSITLFEKVPLQQALTEIPVQNKINQNCNQLFLFNL
jgi:hypothetical protein